MEKPKFPNLLILEPLKSHFIKSSLLNKFFMCFEINGLENLKLTILRFLSLEPPLTHTTLIVVKTFFIVETLFIIHKFT